MTQIEYRIERTVQVQQFEPLKITVGMVYDLPPDQDRKEGWLTVFKSVEAAFESRMKDIEDDS